MADRARSHAIRADFLAAEELEALGERLHAQSHWDLPTWELFAFPERTKYFPDRIKDNASALLTNFRSISKAAQQRLLITPAAEWLLDNHHLVDENVRQVVRDLPKKFYHRLPKVPVEGGGEVPRTLAISWLYIAHTNSCFEPEWLTSLITGFQKHQVLTIGEIWAIPAILRMVLLENLRRISDRVEASRKTRALANRFADAVASSSSGPIDSGLLNSGADATADDTYAAQLLYRLRDGTQGSSDALSWLESLLEQRGTHAEEVIIAEHTRLSMDNLTVGNIIRSLRQIDETDWTKWFESVSRADCVLRARSNFALLDARTRNSYRDVIEHIARRSEFSEKDVALAALELAEQARANPQITAAREKNLGYYFVAEGVSQLQKKTGYRPTLREKVGRTYRSLGVFGIAVPVALLALSFVWMAAQVLAGNGVPVVWLVILSTLFAVPAWDAASGLFQYTAFAFFRPDHLPGYAFKEGVPSDARTLIVIPCLIDSLDSVDELLRNLEVHHLSNPDKEFFFALATDWTDSDEEKSDHDLEVLAYAEAQTNRLAEKYADTGSRRFFLLHRARLWNEAEGVWMGWERKRGKLHELNLLLRGDPDTTFLTPSSELPEDIRYVLTLDSDTRLPRDQVRALVGKLAHPLNAPHWDAAEGKITAGYSILQPRVTSSLTAGSEASAFQRTFSVDRGLDPYVFTVSDIYQDLLGEGSFTGKGLYHVEAFEAGMAGRIAENSVLSHDLLEGSIARAALVTDVEFVEDFPVRYDVDASRQHRWARGDWQLLPLIFSSSSGLNLLGRYKMLDNLRRSVTPIAWLAGSILAWSVLPLETAAVWQVILIISLFIAPTLSLFSAFFPSGTEGLSIGGHIRILASEIFNATAQVALRIVFIAHTAWVMGDAIVRSLYRVFVSRRHLLEWKTADQVSAAAGNTVASFYALMWQSPFIALSAFLLALAFEPQTAVIAGGFCALWVAAPAIAWFVSRPALTEDSLKLDTETETQLRLVARRTWRYFERFVNEDNHYLPPDNFQEDPEPVVAERTSPTNIGMYLLSTVAARDFGWISLSETLDRIDKTLDTVEKLPHHRGHLFNWYNTRTLEVLQPSYVSSVDSGNMAGHLVAVSSALRSWSEAPAVHLLGDMKGVGDVAYILEQSLSKIADDRRKTRPLRRRLEERLAGFLQTFERHMQEPHIAPLRAIKLSVIAAEVTALAVDLNSEIKSTQTASVVAWARSLHATCEAHFADATFDRTKLEQLQEHLQITSERARKIAFDMDFSFLLDETRGLLSIGYRPEDGELDASCYDLLASEARLTSLFAIAKGDVPSSHWFRLGRPIVDVNWQATLASWSGSMFEYLMPPLVMHERRGGLLSQTNRMAIARHKSYGQSHGVPWGISESAYNARDRELNYQYRNFGVPSLGLKRNLINDLVIAPYATALASQYVPADALANFDQLQQYDALGDYGYYDAIDFTPSRLPEGESCAIVRNYMAHHQGMSIVAIANAVHDGLMRDRFHADPVIEAAELLLQEKPPSDLVPLRRADESTQAGDGLTQLQEREFRIVTDPARSRREVLLLSNGHYSVMLTAGGSGYARWNGLAVTRWRPDPTFDDWGNFIFLRDLEDGHWWSATSGPGSSPGEPARTIFSDEKAEFFKTRGTLNSRLECLVASSFDAEGRRVVLTNRGERERTIELTSYCEPVLSADAADSAHPAFSKMFVRTHIGEHGNVIYAERNRRSPSDPDICVAHLISDARGGRAIQAETDRRRFIGRGRSLTDAIAFEPGARLSGSDGYTLDPCMALRRIVRIPPGKEIEVVFWTIAAPRREDIEAAVSHFHHAESFSQELHLAWTRSQVQMRHTDITLQEAALFQKFAGYLVYPDLSLSSDSASVASGEYQQSALWPMGISGDFPIFVLRLDNDGDLPIVQKAFRMQEYLRSRGLISDLVIINERAASYGQDVQNALDAYCQNAARRGLASGPGQHIFAVRRDLMTASAYSALLAAARVVLHTRNGKLSEQLERIETVFGQSGEKGDKRSHGAPQLMLPSPEGSDDTRHRGEAISGTDLLFWNGYGGFDPGSNEYVIRLAAGAATPQPWINVIANEKFGFHISAEGAAFTWSRNSRDYQLTPWTNDPVINRPGEAFYMRDMDDGSLYAPMAALSVDGAATYETRHGPGRSIMTMTCDGLSSRLTTIIAGKEPAKLARLEVSNAKSAPLRLRVYAYAELVLGNDRSRTAPFVQCRFNRAAEAMTATNPYSLTFPERTAFLAADHPAVAFTASRGDFFGSGGTIKRPSMVMSGAATANGAATRGDPCAVIACDIEIPPGETRSVVFMLGDAEKSADVGQMLERLRDRGFAEFEQQTLSQWQRFLGTLQVETPDKAFNTMVNTWLPYQNLACRITARSAFYQASGAFGFRDQLQDTLALLMHDSGLARRQILNAASRQFKEGDVQHWWLPDTGAGVRTKISDDVVWLAYAVSQYVSVTNDVAILDEMVSFLSGRTLEEDEHDAFFEPSSSRTKTSVYDHCARALNLAIARTGPNGLPLILGGDWNDGMNRVGEAGRGESVWLAWFLLHALDRFIPIAEARQEAGDVAEWRAHAKKLTKSIAGAGWDGQWYRRGYYDDGTPLGSSQSEECRIDSIAQSWSVLSGKGNAERSAQAMDSVTDKLIDTDDGLIRLFTPPFQATPKEPGYIKGYPPGVRENGGQYTHAATWVVYALAKMGRTEDAWRAFSMLNPVNHSLDQTAADTYRVEPYVVAADVYGADDKIGRGGWTWYTGSAGWLYRTAVEAILGIEIRGGDLQVNPAIPDDWNGYTAHIEIAGKRREIRVDRSGDGKLTVRIDGELTPHGAESG
ncbi:glucoamylase family protein [Hoeflea sp. YIM 152468]|uniref:GH36-type glycosyl hydrolase domain-containing protein n=1 Tax=Hoeflea sp. YIM 152468 TaxID=3031759 RepID=UPI0023DC1EEF|nr:glucoamylase family protein [Hoeflea sp. YIM 152468]MDF1610304.1 glucoamylase family protein [Hoeflea sp. YIM 152468]